MSRTKSGFGLCMCVRVFVCAGSRLQAEKERVGGAESAPVQSGPPGKALLYALPSLSPQKIVKPSHRGESADIMRKAATQPERTDRRTNRPQPASLRPALGCF